MADTYSYETLKTQYMDFTYPLAQVFIQERDFGENADGFRLSELEVELSCGFEASAVTFSIYGCYDVTARQYRMDKLKKYACLGYPVRVLLGYGSRMTEVFRGFIAQVSYVSREGDPHHVQVIAVDVKGMMMSNCYARQLRADCYSDAVREIFTQSAYQQMNSYGIYDRLSIENTPDKRPDGRSGQVSAETIEMVSESDYEFVVKAAKRFNYEFYVDNGVVIFRKAKGVSGCLIKLGVSAGILEYDISYDVTGLVQTIEARGMDTGSGRVFSASEKYTNKISMGNRARALIAQTKRVYVDAGITSAEEAQYRVSSLLEEMAYRLGSLEAECVGLPELKPGYFIEITGLGEPADNRFYLTEVRHFISDTGGFRTRIRGKAASITP
ncbi:MAG: phage late control D family protein [Lachnospiraceae bacterium]|nr:phage late control D family protein [Lachnospiraceae bacterium]